MISPTLAAPVLLIPLLIPPPLEAAQKPIVAVFNIKSKRVRLKRSVRSALGDYLAHRLAASGAFQVVPRAQLKRRLVRQKRASYRECYDQSCQIDLGRELAAQKSLSSMVMKIGRRCVVTLTLYDLRRATAEHGATAEGPCTEDGIMDAVTKATDELCRAVRAALPKPRPRARKRRGGVTFIETKGKSSHLPARFNPRRFDALGFYPRALSLARKRMGDAVLVDLDVEGVYPAGHADLTLSKEYRANYRFRSPKRSRGNPRLPKNVEQEIQCLVYVEVSAKTIEVFPAVSIDGCKERPLPRFRCSLARAFQLARSKGAPKGNVVAKATWMHDGWYLDFGETSMTVPCR